MVASSPSPRNHSTGAAPSSATSQQRHPTPQSPSRPSTTNSAKMAAGFMSTSTSASSNLSSNLADAQSAPTASPVGGRSFASPAMVRVLLAPAQPGMDPEEFERWATAVRAYDLIRLCDLPRKSKGAVAPGSPLARAGEVHISYVTSYDPSHSFLAPFSLHRQVLGVLGLATYAGGAGPGPHHAAARDALDRAPTALRSLHPNAVIHRVFAFDTGASRPQTMDLAGFSGSSSRPVSLSAGAAGAGAVPSGGDAGLMGHAIPPSSPPTSQATSPVFSPLPASSPSGGFGGRHSSGLVVFPAVRRDNKDVRFYLRTLVPDFVASLLDALETIVEGLEGTSLETPRESLEGAVTARSASAAEGGVAGGPGPTAAAAGAVGALRSPSASGVASSVGAAASNVTSRASALFSSLGSSSSASASKAQAMGGGQQPDGAAGSSLSPQLDGAPSSSSSSSSPWSVSVATSASPGNRLARRAVSTTGTGPTGTGRYAKLRADLALLSGDLWGALRHYEACLATLGKERALAGGQDAVWYASALEGWGVARMLTRRMGGLVEERAPALTLGLLPVTKEKDKKSKEKEAELAAEYPYAKQPWGEIAEAYSLAITIYTKCLAPPSILLDTARSVTNDTPRDYTHPLIHATACLAYARLLLAIWASGGWNGEAFDQLLYGGVPPTLAELQQPSYAVYAQHGTASGIQRHEISAAASQALTHSLEALKPPDRINLLSALASIFGCIGFSRREAYLLRRIQAIVVALLARAVLSTQRSQRAQPSTSCVPLDESVGVALGAMAAGVGGSTEGLGSGGGGGGAGGAAGFLGTMLSHVESQGAGRGSDAVLALTAQVCEVLGINIDVAPVTGMPAGHILTRLAPMLGVPVGGGADVEGGASQETSAGAVGGFRLKRASWGASALLAGASGSPTAAAAAQVADSEEHRSYLQDEAPFGWAEQQVALLKDAASVCELLGDMVGTAFFGALLLRDLHWHLTPEEQRRLQHGLGRAASTVRWQGEAQDFKVLYWGPAEPVCSIEAVPVPLHLVPTEHPPSRLGDDAEWSGAGTRGGAATSTSAAGNPFFWNPARGAPGGTGAGGAALASSTASSSSASRRITLVQHEVCEFLVTLHNPFQAPLEIESVSLFTQGARFDAHEARYVVVAPTSFHTLRLRGTPREPGALSVRGCVLTLAGCAPRRFVVATPGTGGVAPSSSSSSSSAVGEDKRAIARATEMDDRRTRLKATGLDARPLVAAQRRMQLKTSKSASKRATARPEAPSIECRVVPCQPLLEARASYGPAAVGSLIMYEGEETTLRIRVQNVSSTEAATDSDDEGSEGSDAGEDGGVARPLGAARKAGRSSSGSNRGLPIDFVRVTVWDDASEAAQVALGEGNLLPADAYHIERELAARPVLSYDVPARDERRHRLAPGEAKWLKLRLRASPGCTSLRVVLSYGYVSGPGRGGCVTEPAGSFFTRQAVVQASVRVLPVAELGALGVRPLEGGATMAARLLALSDTHDGAIALASTKVSRPEAGQAKDCEYCLLTLDACNMLPHPVELVLPLRVGDEARDGVRGDERRRAVRRTLASGATARLLLPIAKLELSEAQLARPIPNTAFEEDDAPDDPAGAHGGQPPLRRRRPRQFIVSRFQLSPELEAKARRRFWVGEALRARLMADAGGDAVQATGPTWRDLRTGRSGRLDLSGLALGLGDDEVESLLRPPLSVRLEVQDEVVVNGTSEAVSKSGERGRAKIVPAERFVRIVERIQNRTERPLRLSRRLVPLPSASLDHIPPLLSSSAPGSGPTRLTSLTTYGGGEGGGGVGGAALSAAGVQSSDALLSQLVVASGSLEGFVEPWPLAAGAETLVETTVCLLARGEYGFASAVEEVRTAREREADGRSAGKTAASATVERRTALRAWSNETLVLRAV